MLSDLIRRSNEDRREDNDEGFTLIELMVVILIIAILLAIAIPTFLGARSRAQDRAAQSNLRNSLTASKTAYTDTSDYSGANVNSLNALEPSLSFVNSGTTVAAGTNQVSVSTGGDTNHQTVTLAALSSTGTCWYLVDIATSSSQLVPGTFSSPGTWYGHTVNSTSCTAPAAGPPQASSLSGGWSNAHF